MILILDFGSQYTQLIARRIREESVYCEIHPYNLELSEIRRLQPRGVVLSGGPQSVLAKGAPTLGREVLELNLPILGICYGQQLLCHMLGGNVEIAQGREYGPAQIEVRDARGVFAPFSHGTTLQVWMSHGDRVTALPPGFVSLAQSASGPFAAVGNFEKAVFGVQFHPEVAHTPRGKELLRAFLFDVCHCPADWTPSNFVSHTIAQIREEVGSDSVICGLSGGVDSTVAAMLVHRAVGDQLKCIFVDNGLLREGEASEVMSTLGTKLPVHMVDASDEFLQALRGISDPEEKRKTIGRVFIDVFEREARAFAHARYLVQGTLYPDVIESVSFKGPSVVIKSHHNVGGLPERMHLKLIEPLRELFKDEVREVGAVVGASKELLMRHPFPGPGLAIRCLGPLDSEKLAMLRRADQLFIHELREQGLYDQVWQAFAVLLPVKSVGVMGDERSYEYTIALRAVTSVDGMTADWARLPYEFLQIVSTRIINEVPGCNRVVYDVSSKPPATIEWE